MGRPTRLPFFSNPRALRPAAVKPRAHAQATPTANLATHGASSPACRSLDVCGQPLLAWRPLPRSQLMRGSLRMALWKGSTMTTSNHLCIASYEMKPQANHRQKPGSPSWLPQPVPWVQHRSKKCTNYLDSPHACFPKAYWTSCFKDPAIKTSPAPPSRSSAHVASRTCAPRALPQWSAGSAQTSTCLRLGSPRSSQSMTYFVSL